MLIRIIRGYLKQWLNPIYVDRTLYYISNANLHVEAGKEWSRICGDESPSLLEPFVPTQEEGKWVSTLNNLKQFSFSVAT